MTEPERVDAVIVGARCAGSAAAIALARAGRRVVALDRVRFPADTISTHLLWPGGLAEVKTLGALERVQALGAPELPIGLAGAAGMTLRGDFTPIDGIAYALCVRRPGFDAALVERAREAGAEVREGIRVTELVREGGRVCGVRCGDDELRAPLVIGADGRRSTVARLAGAEQPYRWSRSGRDCFYAYWRDARPEWRSTAAQWREGPDLGTAFPCDGGLVLVLVQPPADRAGEYRCIVDAIPELARRLEGCEQVTKVRAATGIASYFRRSAGRGWALAGDAGHFKDPVTAQGIRDALRYGRRLGEVAAPLLDGPPAALDAALSRWERERERDCLEVYQWTNELARGEPLSPLEAELYRVAQDDPALTRQLLDVFSRSERPTAVFTARRTARLTARALLRRRGERASTALRARRDLAGAISAWRERRLALGS